MTTPATASATRPARSRLPRSIWLVTVALPLVVVAAAVAVQLAWLPQLPDPVATHWGGTAAPNGFGPAWSVVALTAGLGIGLVVLFGVILGTVRGAAPTAMHKFLAVTSLATALFVAVLTTVTLAVQLGLDDARDARLEAWMIGASLGAALLPAVLAWFVLPRAVHPGEQQLPTTPLELAPGERSAWIATTRLRGGVLAVIVVAVVLVVVATVLATFASGGAVWPILIAPVIVALVSVVVGVAWRVRVDASGLLVRTLPLGWPRVRIPIAEVASVTAVQVEPLAEFGGWGWRVSPVGGFGLVARRGDALLVTRRDGRRFTVTVDDAATAASLLAAYAASATQIGERAP